MSDDLAREAMADPASVVVTVVGKNGYEVRFTVHGHERTRLEFEQAADQEPMPELSPFDRIWVPSWKRFTFRVTQRFSYRAEDFASLRRVDLTERD